MQGGNTLAMNGNSTYTGGTIVNGGTLALIGGGAQIVGNLTINSGATVNDAGNWCLGSNAPSCVTGIAINGGVLTFTGGFGGGTSATNITMTGGTISGLAPDWYHGLTTTPTLTTNASTATAVISSGFDLRLTSGGNLTFNVAQGTTPSGVDLLVSGPMYSNYGYEGAGGGIIKTGAGVLALSGANSYAGGTTLDGGVLNFAAGSLPLFTNSITFNGGALQWALGNTQDVSAAIAPIASGQTALIDTNGNNVSFYSAISGSGGLTKLGPGVLSMNAANTYTGGTTVNGGTLDLDSGFPTILGNLTINNGATVNATAVWNLGYVSGSCVSGITINGGVLNFSPASAGGFSASNITMTGGTISGNQPDWYNGITSTPTLTTNASTATAVISSGFNFRLGAGSVTFNVPQGTTPSGVDLLISGPITSSNGGGIVKTGAGLLCLSGPLSYYGTTTLSGGTLEFSGTATQTLSGGGSGSGALVMAGPGTLTMSSAITYTGGTTVDGGTLALAPGARIVGNLTINSGATVNVSGGWALGSNSPSCVTGIAINGGVLTFTGPDSYGGTAAPNITMTGGTISAISGTTPDWYDGITSNPTLTTNASTATAVISSGFNLRLDGGSVTFNVSQGTTASGVDLLVSGAITSGNWGNGYYNGVIKTGAGVLCLSAANNYGGPTTISGGALQLGNGGTTGSLATASAITDNGSLIFNRSDAPSQKTDFSGAISGTGSVTQAGPGTLILNTNNTYTGGTTVNGGTLELDSGGPTIVGNLTINNGGTVNVTGVWNLGSVAPSCVSGIAINGGVLAFTAPPNDGGTAASNITMTGGTISAAPGTVPDWYNGITSTPTLTTNASTATAVISSGLNLRLGGNNVTFNVSQGTTASGVDLLISGMITSNYGSGGDGIIKTGAGLLCLSINDIYAGPTLVNGGTLALNGQLTVSPVTVNSGGVLSGTGTVDNLLHVASGGALSPGYVAGAGTLMAGSLTLDSGSILNYTLSPTAGSGFLNVLGAVSLPSSGVTLNISDGGGLGVGTYSLIGYASETGGTSAFSTINVPSSVLAYSLSDTGVLDLVITAMRSLVANGQWGVNSGGTWSTAANWSGGNVPGGNAQDTAVFGTILTSGTANVILDSSRSLSSLGFSTTGANSYVISASNGSELTLSNTGGAAATLSDSGGNHVIAAPITLGSNLNVTAVPGSTLTVSGAIGAGGSQTLAVVGGGADPFWEQHLQRQHDRQRQHAADRQRRQRRGPGEQHHDEQQRHGGVQPRRRALLQRRDQRQRAVGEAGDRQPQPRRQRHIQRPDDDLRGNAGTRRQRRQSAGGDGSDHCLRRRVGPGRESADRGQPERLGRGGRHEPLLRVRRPDVDGGSVLRLDDLRRQHHRQRRLGPFRQRRH